MILCNFLEPNDLGVEIIIKNDGEERVEVEAGVEEKLWFLQ